MLFTLHCVLLFIALNSVPLCLVVLVRGVATATSSYLLTLDEVLLFYIMMPAMEIPGRCNHFVTLQRNG